MGIWILIFQRSCYDPVPHETWVDYFYPLVQGLQVQTFLARRQLAQRSDEKEAAGRALEESERQVREARGEI